MPVIPTTLKVSALDHHLPAVGATVIKTKTNIKKCRKIVATSLCKVFNNEIQHKLGNTLQHSNSNLFLSQQQIFIRNFSMENMKPIVDHVVDVVVVVVKSCKQIQINKNWKREKY